MAATGWERVEEVAAGRVRVGLEAQEDEVDGPDLGGVVRGRRMGLEVPAFREDLHAVAAHGLEVLAARDQGHLCPAPRQGGSDIGADGAGSEDCDFHAAAC